MGTAPCSKCSDVEVGGLKNNISRVLTRGFTRGVDDGGLGTEDHGYETRSSFGSKHARTFDTKNRFVDANTESRKIKDKLLQASRAGKYKALVEAVHEGADIHCRTLREQTPLMLVAGSHSKEAVDAMKFLIDAMADIEAKDEGGWTPLLHACRNNQEDAVNHLLEVQASLKARSVDGKTAVMLAAMDGAHNLVHILVTKKAQIDKKDERGWSVLFFACEDGNHDLVKLLLKKSANARDKAKDSTTPLMVAAETGSKKIGLKLVRKVDKDKGENKLKYINAWNVQGNTALMLCLRAQKEEFAEWLLEEGADVTRANTDGEDALEIADMLGMHSIKNKLEMKSRLATEAEAAGQMG